MPRIKSLLNMAKAADKVSKYCNLEVSDLGGTIDGGITVKATKRGFEVDIDIYQETVIIKCNKLKYRTQWNLSEIESGLKDFCSIFEQ